MIPSKDSIRVYPVVNAFDESVYPVVNAFSPKPRVKKHSRIPWEVGTDERLTDRDIRVYFALASFTRTGPRASAGIRWIADCIHVPPRYVIQSLRRLVETKHVEALPVTSGKRREYLLLSPVFQSTIGKQQETADRPEKARIICLQCHKPRKGVDKLGWCRECRDDVKLDGKVRRLVTKYSKVAS